MQSKPIAAPCAGGLTRREFDDRVEPHVPKMFRAARRVVKSDDLAWDAVQKTLLRLWSNGRLPEEPGGVLLRVVHPASLEVLRAQRRRRHHEECACRACDESSRRDDPAYRAEAVDLEGSVDDSVGALPDDCREAFELFQHEGLDYVAISRRLRIPLGTVRSRLHRARRLLRERLR